MRNAVFDMYYMVAVFLLILGINSLYLACFPLKFVSIIERYSSEYGLSKELVYSVAKAESKFDENAVSVASAKGVMQLVDSTAIYVANIYGFESDLLIENYLFIPEINIKFGCAYLKYLFGKFDSIPLTICAYNAGEGVVKAWLNTGVISVSSYSNIPYKETYYYIQKVLYNMQNYSNILAQKNYATA